MHSQAHKSLAPQEKQDFNVTALIWNLYTHTPQLMFERNFKHIRVVGHEMRLQATGDVVRQFGKVVAILLRENDARHTASFRL